MRNTFLILVSFFCLVNCKHEIERPNWDVEMIIPLVHTNMNINNILSDSALNINENSDGFINLIYEKNFIDINFDTLIKIDAIADEQIHTLDSAKFADVIISDTSTIGEFLFTTVLMILMGFNFISPFI